MSKYEGRNVPNLRPSVDGTGVAQQISELLCDGTADCDRVCDCCIFGGYMPAFKRWLEEIAQERDGMRGGCNQPVRCIR